MRIGTDLAGSGAFLAAGTVASAPFCIAFLMVLIYMRGLPIQIYLGYNMPRPKELLLALGGFLVYLVLSSVLALAAKNDGNGLFVLHAYQTAGSVPFFVFALVVAAPFFEETLFRGFLFHGLESSRLGPLWTIILTASAWAATHLQYDLIGMAQIFLAGLLLGIIRHKTGSTTLAIVVHSLQNALATLAVILKAHSV